jgi:dolichyl-phosphate beta-glucosyltransferase
MAENIKLSVVIPAFNEKKNLEKDVLDQIDSYLTQVDYSYEVVIVDDGSTDETVSLIEQQLKNKKRFRLIKAEHGGKALTVMKGLLESKGEIALFTDMDQATPIVEVEKLLPKFEEGYDIVIGSRHGREGAPLIRKMMAWGFALLRNIFLGLPFSDTQCGFKAFNKSSREKIFPQLSKTWAKAKSRGAAVNAGFDIETLFLAKKLGFEIAEVSVSWHHVGTERVQALKDSIDAMKDMLRIRFNDLFGKYG